MNKVRDYYQNNPSQSVPDIDWAEFERDYQSRQFLENTISRLDALRERLVNAKILHDYDNYQAALEDYAYTSYRAGSAAPGYETKRNELKECLARSKKNDFLNSTDGSKITS